MEITDQDLEHARTTVEAIRREVSSVYVGDGRPIELLVLSLLARGHALLEGVPGVAKTTLVRAFAETLGCSVRRIQFTPDLLPADITGTYVLDPKRGEFALRPGPVFANVVLADEINRAPAKTQSALLEAMQEGQVTIEGDRYALPSPFIVLATQNPVELEGTYPLPEAQIDRFLIRVRMGYPEEDAEVAMLRAHGVSPPDPRRLLDPAQAEQLQSVAARIHVEDDLLDYVVRLARRTRKHPHVVLGASPRASLSLLRVAKAQALVRGRRYLTADDVRDVATTALAHRLVLQPELEGNQDAGDDVVREALRSVAYRREVRAAGAQRL